MGSREQGPEGPRSKALVVHRDFRHALPRTAPSPRRARPSVALDGLPDDALHTVASKLCSARDLCTFEIVSKKCRRAGYDDGLWKGLCRSKFFVPEASRPPSWRELYKFNHKVLYDAICGDILLPKRPGKRLNLGGGRRLLIHVRLMRCSCLAG
eukprot:evm.model.scf_2260.1 EVM.evm.TU.scf_2260.1   scf_2260:4019-6391(+)